MSWTRLIITFFVGSLLWIIIAVWLAFYGTWMTPVADNENDFATWASKTLETKNSGASALVMVNAGNVTAEYYGGPQPINRKTLFAVASFSKWIAALSVMTLVEQGRIDLDQPIEHYLRAWQLPTSEFDHAQVTVRRLLSHTAGLTDGLGFGDYLPQETVPDLLTSLRSPRASSGTRRIAVGQTPGDFLYSGGGYLILELLVQEVSGKSYQEYAAQNIFATLDMGRSTFEYLADQANHAANYHEDGTPAPTYRYASAAATGLATTPADLVKLVRGLTISNPKRPIRDRTLEQMLKPHGSFAGSDIWGLGTMLYVTTAQGAPVFGHDGANDPAINATVRINPDNQQAIIVITSGAPLLASNIGSQWVLWQTGYPDFLFAERAIFSALLPILSGTSILLLALLLLRFRRAHN